MVVKKSTVLFILAAISCVMMGVGIELEKGSIAGPCVLFTLFFVIYGAIEKDNE